MFSNAKVGDRVWSFTDGWGTIIDTSFGQEGDDFPIHVQYSANNTECYTTCGRLYTSNINPTLFWGEIKFEVPKTPLPNLEVDTKVIVWNNGSSGKLRRHFHSFTNNGNIATWNAGDTSFTTADGHYSTWDNWELYEED